MKESFSLRFYLHPLKKKGEKFQIYCRIIVNSLKAELSTIHFIELENWDEERGKAKKGKEGNSINDDLVEIENELRRVRRSIIDEGKQLTARLVKLYYKGEKDLHVALLDYYNAFIDEHRKFAEVKKISVSTVKNYNTSISILKKFLAFKKWNSIEIKNVDFGFINEFNLYLKTTYRTKKGEPISTNHANKQHSRLRTILHKAVREGLIKVNPYSNYKIKNEKTHRAFLTESELEVLRTTSLNGNKSLERVRDFFLFSCFTGLRYEDAFNLKMDDIFIDRDQSEFIEIKMGKTDDKVLVPVLDPAKEIIKKYEDDDARRVFNFVLPRYSNQKINTFLKTIADLVGIEKELTHHVARHTCATYLLNNGVPIEVVQNILGHGDVGTTKIYAKMLATTVKNEMEKINQKMRQLKHEEAK